MGIILESSLLPYFEKIRTRMKPKRRTLYLHLLSFLHGFLHPKSKVPIRNLRARIERTQAQDNYL
jgi:hypothetical protein